MDNLKKVFFELEESHWHKEEVETLWVEPIAGGSNSVFIVKNSPFYVKNISFLDTISVQEHKEFKGMLLFSGVVERSGHSTYRILVDPECGEFSAFWKKLEALGCSYESGEHMTSEKKQMLYSIDVPDTTDVYSVYEILELGEEKDIWGFEEAHCGHPLKE